MGTETDEETITEREKVMLKVGLLGVRLDTIEHRSEDAFKILDVIRLVGELVDERTAARGLVVSLENQLAQVVDLHQPSHPTVPSQCRECGFEDEVWPCDTYKLVGPQL